MTNIFYSYGVVPVENGFNVVVYDLNKNGHDVCFTHSEKIANEIMNHFDNLAMDEEKDLFELEAKN